MISFTASIKQFGQMGEKTGWTYIDIPAKLAEVLSPGQKTSFRVKGKLDDFEIKQVALIPMGGGDFIMAVNKSLQKGIKKRKGANLTVCIELDVSEILINPTFLECLQDEPTALEFFNQLPKSHQTYFSKWIESAKTEETFAKRIALAVTALGYKQGYGEMIRATKK